MHPLNGPSLGPITSRLAILKERPENRSNNCSRIGLWAILTIFRADNAPRDERHTGQDIGLPGQLLCEQPTERLGGRLGGG